MRKESIYMWDLKICTSHVLDQPEILVASLLAMPEKSRQSRGWSVLSKICDYIYNDHGFRIERLRDAIVGCDANRRSQ